MTFNRVKIWLDQERAYVQEYVQEIFAEGIGLREWIDLTPEEIDDIVAYPWGETKDWVAAVAAKLKKKNT